MADRRVEVKLVMDDNFSVHVSRIRELAKTWGDNIALAQATWEPHDWSTS